MFHMTMTGASRSVQLRPSLTQRVALAGTRSGRLLVGRVASAAQTARAVDQAATSALRPYTFPALRVVLGLVFVWFGALKLVGRSPVAALVAQTLPFANQHLVLLILGSAELGLGVLLVSGALVRVALPALAMHLAGTFSTFVVAPALMFSGGDPLLLTADGEFVTKNLVLIAATLVLIAHSPAGAPPSGNSRRPLPTTSGAITRRSSSISPAARND